MRRPLLSASDESGDNERPAAADAHGGSWSDGDASDERPAVDQDVPFGADKGDLDSPSGEYRHDPTPTAADLTSRAESR
jgi:hypothetical protein